MDFHDIEYLSVVLEMILSRSTLTDTKVTALMDHYDIRSVLNLTDATSKLGRCRFALMLYPFCIIRRNDIYRHVFNEVPPRPTKWIDSYDIVEQHPVMAVPTRYRRAFRDFPKQH